jgi:hypothetical protein
MPPCLDHFKGSNYYKHLHKLCDEAQSLQDAIHDGCTRLTEMNAQIGFFLHLLLKFAPHPAATEAAIAEMIAAADLKFPSPPCVSQVPPPPSAPVSFGETGPVTPLMMPAAAKPMKSEFERQSVLLVEEGGGFDCKEVAVMLEQIGFKSEIVPRASDAIVRSFMSPKTARIIFKSSTIDLAQEIRDMEGDDKTRPYTCIVSVGPGKLRQGEDVAAPQGLSAGVVIENCMNGVVKTLKIRARK